MIEKLEVLMEIVQEETGIADIKEKRRTLELVNTKFLYALACLVDTDAKLDYGPVEVARQLDMDHSTINHYVKNEEVFLFQRPYLKKIRQRIKDVYNTSETSKRILFKRLNKLNIERKSIIHELRKVTVV